jgi:hypothetical protein
LSDMENPKNIPPDDIVHVILGGATPHRLSVIKPTIASAHIAFRS